MMSDWTEISRNLKATGDLKGRGRDAEDVYFAFFAGPERAAPVVVVVRAVRTFGRWVRAGGLRQDLPQVDWPRRGKRI